MRYWTSDLHVGHQNIIEFCDRPFWKKADNICGWAANIPDVDAMNKTLIDNWNSVVDSNDEVWVVGDFAMGRLQTTVPMAKKLKGKKFLVPGNHDACHKMHGKWKRFVPLYEGAGFTILDSEVKTHVGKVAVKVCHFPYGFTFSGDDRYLGNRPNNEGGYLIHGHTHSKEKKKDRQIHVGVDAWDYTPVSEDEIAKLIGAR